MCATGGADSAEAAALLAGAGYANVAQMEGGFEGYSAVGAGRALARSTALLPASSAPCWACPRSALAHNTLLRPLPPPPRQVWSPSGKRRPPAGRWVSTGKEALKSGLNIPGVAESYTEGGDLRSARWAQGLAPGEQLPD